jgi:hypothetical protein
LSYAGDYPQLWNWSVEHTQEFWSAVWNYCGIKYSTLYSKVLEDVPMSKIPVVLRLFDPFFVEMVY